MNELYRKKIKKIESFIEKNKNHEEKNISSLSSKKNRITPFKVVADLTSYVLVAFFLGWKLDNFFQKKPIFLIIFIVFSLLSYFCVLYKQIKK